MLQAELGFKERGGKRTGAGRKPKNERPVVSRKARATLTGREPVHITMRMLPGIPNLRVVLHRAVRTALIHGRQKQNFRLVYFAILSNHLHLIVEADSTQAMSRGVQGIAIRMAQNINKALDRKRGRVFSDRYHQRVLRTPTETRSAIHYVINNYRKHMAEAGQRLDPKFIDRLSSAHYLSGRAPSPFPAAETWLLKTGYRRGGGEVDLYCTPGVRRRPRKPVNSVNSCLTA